MIKSDDKTKYSIFYSNSNAETIIYQSDIDDVFESMYSAIISSIQKSLGKDSGWNINSDFDLNSNILNCVTLAGSSYIKLRDCQRNNTSKKSLINIENIK